MKRLPLIVTAVLISLALAPTVVASHPPPSDPEPPVTPNHTEPDPEPEPEPPAKCVRWYPFKRVIRWCYRIWTYWKTKRP